MSETGKLDQLLAEAQVSARWKPSHIVMVLLAAFLLWSALATLDEVSVAAGEVVPQGRIRTIQHLEGGIITQLSVAEGDMVREGAALLQLDLGSAATNPDELRLRLDGYKLTKARLEAEASGTRLVFPEDPSARLPNLASAEMASFEARNKELESTVQVLERQVTQRERDVSEVRVRLASAQQTLALAQERLRMSTDLLKDKLQAPMDHLEVERQATAIKGEMDSLRETLPRAQAALDEARERIAELKLKFSREAREQLNELALNIARTEELLVMASDQETRTAIRSPITGVVKNIRTTTIGGVLRPGEPIMDIVPSEEKLVIEARLDPVDRGFVRAGQKAIVKFDTYDFARYGGLEGEVVTVAPDSTVPETGAPYFRVVVRTDRPYLGSEADQLPIIPGMGAAVEIRTGSKSVLSYLLKPVLKIKSEAFRER
jgi:membrane fusion protein, adhesin transport system